MGSCARCPGLDPGLSNVRVWLVGLHAACTMLPCSHAGCRRQDLRSLGLACSLRSGSPDCSLGTRHGLCKLSTVCRSPNPDMQLCPNLAATQQHPQKLKQQGWRQQQQAQTPRQQASRRQQAFRKLQEHQLLKQPCNSLQISQQTRQQEPLMVIRLRPCQPCLLLQSREEQLPGSDRKTPLPPARSRLPQRMLHRSTQVQMGQRSRSPPLCRDQSPPLHQGAASPHLLGASPFLPALYLSQGLYCARHPPGLHGLFPQTGQRQYSPRSACSYTWLETGSRWPWCWLRSWAGSCGRLWRQLPAWASTWTPTWPSPAGC